MGKLDELRRTAGANVTESASKRDTTLAPIAPTLASLSPARMAGVARSKSALEIPVDRIEPDPDQPREDFDEVTLRGWPIRSSSGDNFNQCGSGGMRAGGSMSSSAVKDAGGPPGWPGSRP